MRAPAADDPRRHLLALVLLLICGALLWTSERSRSVTADESLHLVRGHAFWWTHEARLSYAHPPLANAINTLPYAGRGDQRWGEGAGADGTPRTETRSFEADADATRAEALRAYKDWKVSQPLGVATAYFGHDFGQAKAELQGARRMMMLWALALGLFIYLWTERRWGWPAATVSLALYAVHPTLLAHGRLMTTDFPLAATAFVSLAAVIAWIERPGWARAAWFGLATTAMVLTKHSGLPFVVIMSVGLLVAAWAGAGGFEQGSRGRRVATVFAQLCVVAVVMILAIDAIYLFERVGLRVDEILAEPEPHNWISRKFEFELLESSPIARLPDGLRLPFPYTWLVGLATVSKQNAVGHGNYFFGLRSHRGHPLYFPVMLFAKSPTGLLVLLGAGAGLVIQRWRSGLAPSLTTRVLASFALVTLASACLSKINIGVRHVLPLMPIMVVLAGRAGQLLLADASEVGELLPAWLRARQRRAVIVGACVLGSLAGALSTFPNYLGDFNALVGGPAGGHRISVIGEDWGQDMGDLADLATDRGWERVAYYTTFPLRSNELGARGIAVRRLKCKRAYDGPDPIVIHLSAWARRPQCFEWLGGRQPDLVVNHHLLVFEPR